MQLVCLNRFKIFLVKSHSHAARISHRSKYLINEHVFSGTSLTFRLCYVLHSRRTSTLSCTASVTVTGSTTMRGKGRRRAVRRMSAPTKPRSSSVWKPNCTTNRGMPRRSRWRKREYTRPCTRNLKWRFEISRKHFLLLCCGDVWVPWDNKNKKHNILA